MPGNYLNGSAGDQIDTLLASTIYKYEEIDEIKEEEILNTIFWLFFGMYIWVHENTQSSQINKDQLK